MFIKKCLNNKACKYEGASKIGEKEYDKHTCVFGVGTSSLSHFGISHWVFLKRETKLNDTAMTK